MYLFTRSGLYKVTQFLKGNASTYQRDFVTLDTCKESVIGYYLQ